VIIVPIVTGLLALIGTVVVAYIQFYLPNKLSIEATQTAEAGPALVSPGATTTYAKEVTEGQAVQVITPTEWASCGWFPVGALNSHQRKFDWCPNGSYMVQFNLDPEPGGNEGDSPVVGQAKCCTLPGTQFTQWGLCDWVEVGMLNSFRGISDWCPSGAALVQFDLDSLEDPYDGPIVGRARCCSLPGAQFSEWGACEWVSVGKQKSLEPGAEEWYRGVAFLVQFELDSEQGLTEYESPIVGQARFCRLRNFP
jgi:hypothetical protein